ncbi:MAG: hypothetical protein M1838_002567 [Thelocarpon superellum]|nr:MAG: hypothetical protein M1838_002567 [Thelocarpon superellum]
MTSLAEYSTSQVHKRVISNLSSESCQLTILPLGSDASVPHETYVIPPKATFLLANVQESAIFEDGVRHLMSSTPSTAGSEPFDLILLDPPWPNASAKRAKTYGRPRSTADIHHLLLSLPLRAHIAAAGLVGVWITNKIRFRSLVLGDQDGASECRSLFNAWGLELVEEWIWIKVTKRGEPITDLESAWRKPYEMLLLGRRTARALHGSSGDDDRHKIKRRIIAGVPDIHSRKPSLRELLAPLMPRPEYRALEIFARNLTQGWWAWGDEVLKFNEVGWWSGGRTEGTSD